MKPKHFAYILLGTYIVLTVLFIIDMQQDDYRWYPYLGILANLLGIIVVLMYLRGKKE